MVYQHDQFLRTQMQGKYSQLEAAKYDAVNAMMHYKDLKPSCDRFVYNDGSSKKLVYLSGTIPVMFRGTTYHIPVSIWLQEPHPQTPPLCFVKPTSTMNVRQGKYVDGNGRIYLPYLNEWRAGSHSIIGCIQVMIAIFGVEPPVVSKQAPPRPPPPHAVPYPMQSSQRLPYPPTGFAAQGPPTTNYQPNIAPVSPYPPANTNQSSPYPTPYPTPAPNSAYPPYPRYPSNNQIVRMPATPYPTPPRVVSPLQTKSAGIDDAMIRASLLSAVNDKIKRRMKDTLAQADSELALLKQTEKELRRGGEKLETILKRLESEIDDAENSIFMLRTKTDAIGKEIERVQQHQDNVEVDDMVMATNPLYAQIFSSFAEEQGLEDVIYYLGEALHKNVVDIDTYLKQIRSLSRQQFVLRAIIQKARKSAGLANVY